MPELDFLEEQLQVDWLAAGRRRKAVLDLRPLIITNLRPALGSHRSKQQASFGLRENVQLDEFSAGMGGVEFGVRLAGGITGGPVGQAGNNELHVGRQRAKRQPVQQSAIIHIGKLVEGVQEQDQWLLRRGGLQMLGEFVA